jgi:type II secretory pathway component PulF
MHTTYIIFLKNLGYLLKASIPLAEAFDIALSQSSNSIKRILRPVHERIHEGVSLADALSGIDGGIDFVTQATIRAGQVSGFLGEKVLCASQRLEKNKHFKNELISSLLYPCIVSVVALLLILFLLGYVYPQIIPMFESFKATLPWSTRCIMFMSLAVRTYGVWCVAVSVILILFLHYVYNKYGPARELFEKCIYVLPIVGRLYYVFQLQIVAEIMSSVIQQEHILEVAKIGASSSSSLVLKKRLERVVLNIQEGQSFSDALDNRFPSIWKSMLVVGEKTGRLGQSFSHIATFHEAELRSSLNRLTKLIEPLLMIVTGCIVGLIALSIVTPLYSLTQTVQGI